MTDVAPIEAVSCASNAAAEAQGMGALHVGIAVLEALLNEGHVQLTPSEGDKFDFWTKQELGRNYKELAEQKGVLVQLVIEAASELHCSHHVLGPSLSWTMCQASSCNRLFHALQECGVNVYAL